MKKTILLIGDPTDGGGAPSELAKLISRLEALDARVSVTEKSKDLEALAKRVGGLEKVIKDLSGLSDKLAAIELKVETLPNIESLEERLTVLENAEPSEVRLAPAVIKSTTDHFREELAALERDPSDRLQSLIDGGVPEEKARGTIQGRISHLKRELGIVSKTRGKKTATVAAMLIGLFVLAASLLSGATRCRADQQGYPQAFQLMTNMPGQVLASGVTNLLSPTGTTNLIANLTNSVTIHRGAGIGLEWFFNTAPGAVGTNCSLFIAPSIDGTNMDSYQLWQVYGTSGGGTNVCIATNWNANQLGGYKSLLIVKETNGCLVPITNGPVLWNVPQGGPGS